jgi:acyl-CoA dehydrogenase
MDFIVSLLDPDQRQLQADVERLIGAELTPLELDIGESDSVSRPLVAALANAGLLDWTVPGAYGTGRASGVPAAMSLTSFCVVREALARAAPNAELIFTMQGLGAGPISFSGTDDQRRRYLPRIASGELVAAFALTEPEAGSDVAAIATTARREGSDYILDGRKAFISMAPDADVYIVFAMWDIG